MPNVQRVTAPELPSQREALVDLLIDAVEHGSSGAEAFYRALGYTCIGGLPEYACSPQGEWRANAIYYRTLFRRNPR
jgi:acetyltransferase